MTWKIDSNSGNKTDLKNTKTKSDILILDILKNLGLEKNRLISADTKMILLLTTILPY